jgi:hypothetical protein
MLYWWKLLTIRGGSRAVVADGASALQAAHQVIVDVQVSQVAWRRGREEVGFERGLCTVVRRLLEQLVELTLGPSAWLDGWLG